MATEDSSQPVKKSNLFQTVRNHWKKSIALIAIGAYGLHYAKGIYEDDLLRRQYCEEARKYGEMPIQLGNKTRKVTVFLNPAASHGGAKKLFEKNAAPILYLAGLEVNVVKTEYEGQIKEYMKVFEQKYADAIIVAGGNVSVLELVTGMMRKDDKSFRKKTPIGIIPIGSQNKFATFFYGPEKSNVRRCLDAAMSVVKGMTKNVDVIQFQGSGTSPTYALCGMEAGAYKDAQERVSKYWYFGPLKHRYTYLRTTLSKWPPTLKGNIAYVPLTEENAVTKPKIEVKPVETPKQSWSWKNIIFGNRSRRQVPEQGMEEEEEYDCEGDEVISRDIEAVEINMNSGFTKTDKKLRGVELELGPSEIDKSTFISEGWSRLKEKVWNTGCDTNDKILVKMVKFTPEVQEGKELWFNLDGEQFEAKPITVTLLKDRLKLFTEATPSVDSR